MDYVSDIMQSLRDQRLILMDSPHARKEFTDEWRRLLKTVNLCSSAEMYKGMQCVWTGVAR